MAGHLMVIMIPVVTESKGKGTKPDTILGGFLKEERSVVVRVPHSSNLLPATTEVDRVDIRKKRKARSIKLAVMGISQDILDKADPRYAAAVSMANKYRRVRSAEISEMHGSVSVGASALLASGGLALAASRFLYEKFAENGGGELGVGMLKLAASLADSARQSELAAWEMSAREGLVKRKLQARDMGVPWLAQDADAKNKGRKSNLERNEKLNEQVVTTPDGSEILFPDA